MDAQPPPRDRRAELRATAAELQERFRDAFVGRCVVRVLELRPFDRAVAIASRAFIAFLPLAIVANSLSPAAQDGGFAEALIDRLGLEGEGAERVRQLFATPDEVRGGITFLGVLVLVYSVLGFARLLARLYEAAWRLPPGGLRGLARGLVWIAAVVAYVSFVGPLLRAAEDHVGGVVSHVMLFISATLVWLFTPYILLAGRIPFRSLLPTGLLTAAALGIFGFFSAIYMPEAVSNSGERYGLVGVSFSIVSWLIGVGVALVLTAAVGAVAAERWVPPDGLGPSEDRPAPQPLGDHVGDL